MMSPKEASVDESDGSSSFAPIKKAASKNTSSLVFVILYFLSIMVDESDGSSASAFASVVHMARGRRSLEHEGLEKFHLDKPKVFHCDDSGSFVMRFDITDYIQNDMVDFQLFRADENGEFTIDITDNPYLRPGLVFDGTEMQGDGTANRQIAYFLDLDPDLITTSEVYHPAKQPYIHFLTRLLLYNRPGGILINWIDVEFYFVLHLNNVGVENSWRRRKLLRALQQDLEEELHHDDPVPIVLSQFSRQLNSVGCQDGFEVVFDVNEATEAPTFSPAPTAPTYSPAPTTDDGTVIVKNPMKPLNITAGTQYHDATDSYGVEAYLCDGKLEPIEPIQIPLEDSNVVATTVLELGDMARVCVERNAKSIRDGVYLRQIDAFAFFKWGDTEVRQVAIAPTAKPAGNGLTQVHCPMGSEKCYFETLLVGEFFSQSGRVTGSGKASLQFGAAPAAPSLGQENRQLQQADVYDSSLVDDNDGVGSMSLTFAVLTPEDMETVRAGGAILSSGKETNKRSTKMLATLLSSTIGLLSLVLFLRLTRLAKKKKCDDELSHTNRNSKLFEVDKQHSSRTAATIAGFLTEHSRRFMMGDNIDKSSRRGSRRTGIRTEDKNKIDLQDGDDDGGGGEDSSDEIGGEPSSSSRRSRSRRSSHHRRSTRHSKRSESRWLWDDDEELEEEVQDEEKSSYSRRSNRSRREALSPSRRSKHSWREALSSRHSKRSERRWLWDDEELEEGVQDEEKSSRNRSKHGSSLRDNRTVDRTRNNIDDEEASRSRRSRSFQHSRSKHGYEGSEGDRSRRSRSSQHSRSKHDYEGSEGDRSGHSHRRGRSRSRRSERKVYTYDERDSEDDDKTTSSRRNSRRNSSQNRSRTGERQHAFYDYGNDSDEEKSSSSHRSSSRRRPRSRSRTGGEEDSRHRRGLRRSKTRTSNSEYRTGRWLWDDEELEGGGVSSCGGEQPTTRNHRSPSRRRRTCNKGFRHSDHGIQLWDDDENKLMLNDDDDDDPIKVEESGDDNNQYISSLRQDIRSILKRHLVTTDYKEKNQEDLEVWQKSRPDATKCEGKGEHHNVSII